MAGLMDFFGQLQNPEQADVRAIDNQLAAPAMPMPMAAQAKRPSAPLFQVPQEQEVGFFDRPETWAGLAMGLNSMRMNPDQNMGALWAKQIENIAAEKKAAKANKYFEALSAGGQDIKALVPEMMKTPEGRAALSQYATVMPALRKAGMMGNVYQENPFDVFTLSESPNVKRLATQYKNSYSSGMIDPEDVDKRVQILTNMDDKWTEKRHAEILRQHDKDIAFQNQMAMARLTAGLKPERTVTVMDENTGSPYVVPESDAISNNLPRYSPAAAKAIIVKNEQGKARTDFNSLVNEVADKYKQLKELGGIKHSGQTGVENVATGFATSDFGQKIGNAWGTKEQSLRNDIAAIKPLMLIALKKGGGVTGGEMNTQAEAERYLTALTDPKKDYESSIASLERLDNLYGAGLFKADAFNKVNSQNKTSPNNPFATRK